jgi:hypothetical protein
MSIDDQPSLLRLGNATELLEAMEAIIASPPAGLDEQSKSRLARHQTVVRDAFRRAMSEAEGSRATSCS